MAEFNVDTLRGRRIADLWEKARGSLFQYEMSLKGQHISTKE